MPNSSLDLLGGSGPTRNQNSRKMGFPVPMLDEDAFCGRRDQRQAIAIELRIGESAQKAPSRRSVIQPVLI